MQTEHPHCHCCGILKFQQLAFSRRMKHRLDETRRTVFTHTLARPSAICYAISGLCQPWYHSSRALTYRLCGGHYAFVGVCIHCSVGDTQLEQNANVVWNIKHPIVESLLIMRHVVSFELENNFISRITAVSN